MTFIVTFLYSLLPAILHFCNFIVGFIFFKVMFLHNLERTVWIGYFDKVVSVKLHQIMPHSIYLYSYAEILMWFSFTMTIHLSLQATQMNFQVFKVIRKQDWYRPDAYLYKD